MEQLFAPWRIEWVERSEEQRNTDIDGCVFCNLPQQSADAQHRILARSDEAYLLLNNAPYNPGHMMVIPFEHTRELHELSEAAYADFGALQQIASEVLTNAFEPQGLNIGMNISSAGGASVPNHLHAHVVPRWHSDTGFMPVTGKIAIVEEALDATYERLRNVLSGQDYTSFEEGTGVLTIQL
jgi:ATP adenylyltransferase